MKLPFTTEDFLKVFEKYNLAVWPMQYALYLIAIASVILAVKTTSYSSKYISLSLAMLWLWMGIVYHLLFFTIINKAAYGFGLMFIIQGFLFLFQGFYRKKFSFELKNDIYGIAGAVMILFALLIYPVIGYYAGHIYPANPTFGLPCPTTIFTLGIILWMKNRCPVYILIIPLLWSLLGFSAAYFLGMHEDTGLLITGILAAVLIVIKNQRKQIPMPS